MDNATSTPARHRAFHTFQAFHTRRRSKQSTGHRIHYFASFAYPNPTAGHRPTQWIAGSETRDPAREPDGDVTHQPYDARSEIDSEVDEEVPEQASKASSGQHRQLERDQGSPVRRDAKNRRNSEQKTQASPVGETMMMVRVKEPPGKLYVLQPTVFYRWEGDRLPIYLLPINFDLCLKITLPWKGAKFVTRFSNTSDSTEKMDLRPSHMSPDMGHGPEIMRSTPSGQADLGRGSRVLHSHPENFS
ncbi:hypothetical protein R3P38DRAFT_3355969 [Favolaschia claudopus]|uniref:Uncharacterized protein n=1 Tax=Favolaschia claudopus TaxID=2862362 RepID=A0AAW0BI92_9AGAR